MKIKTQNNWMPAAEIKKVSEVKEKLTLRNNENGSGNVSDARNSNKTVSAHSEYRTSGPVEQILQQQTRRLLPPRIANIKSEMVFRTNPQKVKTNPIMVMYDPK